MNYIGNIIKEFRLKENLSRSDLAKGICTEKYIYLIEKGKRTPSSEITKLLGDKLGRDLFKYYEYLDCKYPIEVCHFIENFSVIRDENNQIKLMEETNKAKKISDFSKPPWIYEIILNELSYIVLHEGKIKEGIEKTKNILRKMDKQYSNNIYVASYYVLLGTCYQIIEDFKKAEKAVECAYKIIENKEKIYKYSSIIESVKINKITLLYKQKKLKEVIKECDDLEKYQMKISSYFRSNHTFFYKSCAYFEMGLKEESIKWFLKTVYMFLVHDKELDLYYFTTYKTFYDIFNNPKIPDILKIELKNKYKFIK